MLDRAWLLQETSLASFMFDRRKKNHVWYSNFSRRLGIGLYVKAV
jgi:hypothetical protein